MPWTVQNKQSSECPTVSVPAESVRSRVDVYIGEDTVVYVKDGVQYLFYKEDSMDNGQREYIANEILDGKHCYTKTSVPRDLSKLQHVATYRREF